MHRCSSITSLAGLLLVSFAATAAELPLREFTANYELHQDGLHLGHTSLSLQRDGTSWSWRMSTEPRSVYSLFVRRRPVSETRIETGADGIRLQRISITDKTRPERDELARFDWQRHRLDIVRKGRRRDLPLANDVYDYHSIHLLAATMTRDRIAQKDIDFYRKGKLVRARLIFGGSEQVRIRGKSIEAVVYEQVISGTKSKMKYYFDAANPILPLRIERFEKGKRDSLLTLQRVDWKL